MLLTVDDPSEATMTFLGKKSYSIAKQILGNLLTYSVTQSLTRSLTHLDVFNENSTASFYHAYRIFGSLLRHFPSDVYAAICADNKVTHNVESILKYIGYAPGLL